MATNPIVLVLGAGPGIGLAVARKFAQNGYKVAIASRNAGSSAQTTADGFLSLRADFAQPSSVPALFAAVEAEWKAAPSVVVYNAAALTPPPVQGAVFSTPTEAVLSDLNVNTISPYVAAQQAVRGWQTLAPGTRKTFIYTGNILNQVVLPTPSMLTLGMGKSAAAYWIGVADAQYSAQGSRCVTANKAVQTTMTDP